MKISVIIPVYNTGQYLDACLTSLFEQEIKDIEVICVDDGSVDNSPALLATWAAREPRIRIIRQDNAGQGAARNRGLAEACGEFLLFVDSDDMLLPGAMSLLLREVGDAQVIAFDHITFSTQISFKPALITHAQQVPREKLLRQMGVVWNKMVRRDWWLSKSIRFREGVIFEDIPVHWKLVLLPERIVYLPAILYALRVRSDSTTGANSVTSRRLESISAHDEVAELFRTNQKWMLYDAIRREIMLRNLSGCIDALQYSNPLIVNTLRRIVTEQLTGIDLSTRKNLGLSWRELDTLRAFQGHLPSQIRQKTFHALRVLIRFVKKLYQ